MARTDHRASPHPPPPMDGKRSDSKSPFVPVVVVVVVTARSRVPGVWCLAPGCVRERVRACIRACSVQRAARKGRSSTCAYVGLCAWTFALVSGPCAGLWTLCSVPGPHACVRAPACTHLSLDSCLSLGLVPEPKSKPTCRPSPMVRSPPSSSFARHTS